MDGKSTTCTGVAIEALLIKLTDAITVSKLPEKCIFRQQKAVFLGRFPLFLQVFPFIARVSGYDSKGMVTKVFL